MTVSTDVSSPFTALHTPRHPSNDKILGIHSDVITYDLLPALVTLFAHSRQRNRRNVRSFA